MRKTRKTGYETVKKIEIASDFNNSIPQKTSFKCLQGITYFMNENK